MDNGTGNPFPDVAASSKRGEQLYAMHCTRCHGPSGEGQMQYDSATYIYPPLWGSGSKHAPCY